VGVISTWWGVQHFHYDSRTTVPYPPKGQFHALGFGFLSIIFGAFWFIRGKITMR